MGFSHDPAWRWGNEMYGYAHAKDRWTNMEVLYIAKVLCPPPGTPPRAKVRTVAPSRNGVVQPPPPAAARAGGQASAAAAALGFRV